jgi:hypothetical protein
MDARHSPRTAHVIVPSTGRPLCGYEEEERSGAEERASAVACPECSALLREGLARRRSMFPSGR